MKLLRLVSLALLAVGFTAVTAYAFHDGGVAYCAGCHTMHNSQDGEPVDPDAPNGNAYLLRDSDATAVCLRCHAGYGQFADGFGYGPGGDFGWLTKTFSWTSHGHENVSTGDSHGHNLVSEGYGLTADATLLVSPGGDFDGDNLGCTSCHDPHGNQNFRILYGSALGPVYNGGRYDFDYDAPVARGNSRTTTPGSSGEETNSQHTVYKTGMSDWCANCHAEFHSGITTDFVHPTGDDLGSAVAANYNGYVSTDDLNGGNQETAWWGLVPFEAVNVDLEAIDPRDYTLGPFASDQVMCVTCHRAHASAFPDIGRWDFGATFIIESHPEDGDTGASEDDILNKYYAYTFVTNQRSLCNKCHLKDAFDAPF